MPLQNVQKFQNEGRSFTSLFKKYNNPESEIMISKIFPHPSGRIVLASVKENSEFSKKKFKTMFYSVLKNQSFLSEESTSANIQCVEFLDAILPYSEEFKNLESQKQNKFYSCLLGCKNGDLFYASFFNDEPVRVELKKIFGFVRKSNNGNAQMCSLKIIKLFVPEKSQKR